MAVAVAAPAVHAGWVAAWCPGRLLSVLLNKLSSCAAGFIATDFVRVGSILRFTRGDEIKKVLLITIAHFIRVVFDGVALHASMPM